MVTNEQKFVDFHGHCTWCKYTKVREEDEPCRECLATPVNAYSSRPKFFEKKEKKSK